MGKYLDKTGLQYFYGKLKEKFADKTTIENKLNSLTGALTWKGELSALPATTNYTAGNVIKVGKKEYVLTEVNGTKSWDELGDEGSYLLKTTAEETYLKKAAGEVKTDNLADGSVTPEKQAQLIITERMRGKSIPNDWMSVLLSMTDLSTPPNAMASSVYYFQGNNYRSKIPLFSVYPRGVETQLYFVDFNPMVDEVDFAKDDINFIGVNYVLVTLSKYNNTWIIGKIKESFISIKDLLNNDTSYLDGKVLKDSTVTKSKLSTDVQDSLDKADNSLQKGNVSTPTSDTDAANKAYVDGKIIPTLTVDFEETEESISDSIELFLSKNNFTLGNNNQFIFDIQNDWTTLGVSYSRALMGFTCAISDDDNTMKYSYCGVVCADLATDTPIRYLTVYIVVPTENSEINVKYKIDMFCEGCISKIAVDNMLSNMVNQSTLATSLQAIIIYTDNTAAHKAANLANIKAYEDNLKDMWADPSKDHIIPIAISGTIQKGFLNGNTSTNRYQGMIGQDNQWSACVVASDGTFASDIVLSTGRNMPALTTTAKQIIPAINEVNTLATRKATLTQDGVVRVELKEADSDYGSLQSSVYPKIKVARDKNGVLAVGAAKDKSTYGVVKIGDGINVTTEGVISVSAATTSANGLMSSDDKKKLDGVAEGATKVTGININGTVKTATNGIFTLGTVLTSVDTGLNASSNNAISNSAVVAALNTKVNKTGLMTINNQAITGGGNINVATEKVTLAYNPDDSYMTGDQYRNIFTDAYEVGKIPNVELVYTAEGDYEVLALKRIDKDDDYYHLYFSSSSVEDTTNVWIYGVQVDVLIEDGSTTDNHDMTCTELQSTSFNSLTKTAINSIDATEILTTSTVVKSLTMFDKRDFIIMPTVESAQIKVPAYPTDGYTITVTGIAAVQNFELRTSSSSAPIYNVNSSSTATKYSLSSRGKVVSTYSATLKQWITYKQAIN